MLDAALVDAFKHVTGPFQALQVRTGHSNCRILTDYFFRTLDLRGSQRQYSSHNIIFAAISAFSLAVDRLHLSDDSHVNITDFSCKHSVGS